MMKTQLPPPGEEDSLEEYPRPLNIVRYGVAAVALTFCGMLIWAAWAPLDKGVTVSGQVVVADNRKTVQPVSGGRITMLKVRDGEFVQAGQTLALMDSIPTRAMRDNLMHQQLEARVNQSRLLAERDGLSQLIFPDSLTYPSDVINQTQLAQFRFSQQQLFNSRRAARQQETTAMRSTIEGIAAQIAGSKGMLQGYQDQIKLLAQQLQRLRPLVQQGYVAANRLSELDRQHAQLTGTLLQERNNIVRMQQQMQELKQTLAQRESEYRKEIHSQLVDTQHLVQDLGQRLKAAEYELRNTIIVAPVSGTVVGLSLHTEGGVVGSGQVLMEIVPDGQPLLVAAQLPVHLIDKVSPDAQVELLFTAFNQTTTPRISGSITLIGADQLQNPKTDLPYYDLRIRVNDNDSALLDSFDIRPGMPVEAFIRTGERSLLNYLFKPLFDRLRLALTEE